MNVEILADGAGGYTGTVVMGQHQFPLKARQQGNRLDGTFTSQRHAFPFAVEMEDGKLRLTTDRATYRLASQDKSVNSLVKVKRTQGTKPEPRNPLAGGSGAGAASKTTPANRLPQQWQQQQSVADTASDVPEGCMHVTATRNGRAMIVVKSGVDTHARCSKTYATSSTSSSRVS